MASVTVLLIVGAAVIGPIGAKIHDDPTDKFTVCPYERGRTERRGCRTKPGIPESLPELCARAMREIGAVIYQDTSGNTQATPMFGHIVGTTWGNIGSDVTCIAVPEGYRK